jgi:hypothetical protein
MVIMTCNIRAFGTIQKDLSCFQPRKDVSVAKMREEE